MTDPELFLKIGHYCWVDKPLEKYLKIVATEPFDYETGEENTPVFSQVASGAESGFKNIELLEPDNRPFHMYQVLWGVWDLEDIKYYIKIPTGVNVFGVDEDREIGFINASKSFANDPDALYQFYLITKWYPSVNCVNNSPVTITPKVRFCGMKYETEDVSDPQTLSQLKAGAPQRKIRFGFLKNTQ